MKSHLLNGANIFYIHINIPYIPKFKKNTSCAIICFYINKTKYNSCKSAICLKKF